MLVGTSFALKSADPHIGWQCRSVIIVSPNPPSNPSFVTGGITVEMASPDRRQTDTTAYLEGIESEIFSRGEEGLAWHPLANLTAGL